MSTIRLAQRLESLVEKLVVPAVPPAEVFPGVVQDVVRWSSGYALSVAATDRFGKVFFPAATHWYGMHHSFYQLQYSEDGSYLPVGLLVIPQRDIKDVGSIVACVKRALQEYPSEGVIVRREQVFVMPTGDGHHLEHAYFKPEARRFHHGFPGRSILYGGENVCHCASGCDLCERSVLTPRSEFFIS